MSPIIARMKIQFKSVGNMYSRNINSAKGSGYDYLYDDPSQLDHQPRTRTVPHACGWLLAPIILIAIVLFSFLSLYALWSYGQYYSLLPFGTVQFFDGKKRDVDISWSNCGKNIYGKLNTLHLDPSPVDLHKNLTLIADAEIYQDLYAPISIKVTFKKKFWVSWISIPCIDSIGSCSYDDICQYSPYLHNATCILPLPHSHLPCNCPIKKGQYYANRSTIELVDPFKIIPKWLEDGRYSVQVKGFSNDTELGCYQFYFSVK